MGDNIQSWCHPRAYLYTCPSTAWASSYSDNTGHRNSIGSMSHQRLRPMPDVIRTDNFVIFRIFRSVNIHTFYCTVWHIPTPCIVTVIHMEDFVKSRLDSYPDRL